MAKTTSYYIFGNKVYYPSTVNNNVPNQLSNNDQYIANIYKPNSYAPENFGTDFTNTNMRTYTTNPYEDLTFYYQLINQKNRGN